jgi:hypothetical protein
MVASKSFASLRLRPTEEPFDDPAARVDGEADLIGIFAHDFDGD